MEKDKMIDKVCEKMCAVYFDNDGTCSFDGLLCLCHDDKQCVNRQNAKDLIDELIPEGAVVLTREEYEELNKHQEKEKQYLDALERLSTEKCALYCPLVVKARKETAKEIFSAIDKYSDKCFETVDNGIDCETYDKFDYYKFFRWLEKYAKEIGVEVE